MPEAQPELATLIKAYRARLGVTQEGLADRWRCSVGAVRRIEQGRPTTHAHALVDLLGQLPD